MLANWRTEDGDDVNDRRLRRVRHPFQSRKEERLLIPAATALRGSRHGRAALSRACHFLSRCRSMMMPPHGDVGTIHGLSCHLMFGTLRTIIVVGVRCRTGFP